VSHPTPLQGSRLPYQRQRLRCSRELDKPLLRNYVAHLDSRDQQEAAPKPTVVHL